jgi:hypothetical protein
MHVITYSPNFAPPHFAARGIPKNMPHGTVEGHTAYIYVVCLPLPDETFFLFFYTQSTLLHGLTFLYGMEKVGDAVPMGKLLFLSVCLQDVNVPIT